MNLDFWRNKRVLLTGHTGFKGSWISLWLQSLGAELTGFALQPPTTPSLFEEANVAGGMRSTIGDIRDLQLLQQTFQNAQPEIIIHMAAQSLVRYSYQSPVETYATNVMGTVHLLEAVRKTPSVKAVLNVTSDKCYENQEWVWGYREHEPMGGHDPYSNSKGCAELVTAAYRSSFFNKGTNNPHEVGVATARAGNVIGGGDWAKERLIPDILNGFEQGEVVNIRYPHAIRPWQHVLEPLHGYLALAELLYLHGLEYAEAWNFGPNYEDTKTVGWIVERMAELWGNQAKWQIDRGTHPHEAAFLKLDISKAHSRLNWKPVLRLEQSLKLIIDWFKKRQSGEDVRRITQQQINQYLKIAGIGI